MKNRFIILAAALGGAVLLLPPASEPVKPAYPKSAPAPVVPAPIPVIPPSEPDPPRPSWPHGTASADAPGSGAMFGSRDGSTHEGQTVQVDLPTDQLVRNCGGSDGSGLCVFTSIMFAARLQNVPQLKDFQAWMKKHPGGGYPQKVDKMIAQKCKEQNIPVPDYIQIENGDWSLVELALKTGRMPAITYGSAHMVNIVCLVNNKGAFRDNNFIGEKELDWMTADQAKQKAGGKRFWSVVLLAPRPPMPPKNSTVAASCAAPYIPGKYEWRRFPDLLQWSLWRDGEQVGGYDGTEDFYAVRESPGKWGPFYRRPPVELPLDAFPSLAGRIPGGVSYSFEGNARYSRNGIVISREEAFAAMKLEDDSKKLSLTVIGTQAEQDAVRARIVAIPDFSSQVLFQGYLPTDWAISGKYGFVHDGNPTISLQQPDGTELLHLTSLTADTLQQLRVKDPNYKPASPDAKKPSTPSDGGTNDPAPLLILGAGVAVFLFLRKGK